MDVKTFSTDNPNAYKVELANNNKIMVEQVWNDLPLENKELLCEVLSKVQIVQSLDDGYGKVILEIQKKRVFSVKLMQEKMVRPLKAEMF